MKELVAKPDDLGRMGDSHDGRREVTLLKLSSDLHMLEETWTHTHIHKLTHTDTH